MYIMYYYIACKCIICVSRIDIQYPWIKKNIRFHIRKYSKDIRWISKCDPLTPLCFNFVKYRKRQLPLCDVIEVPQTSSLLSTTSVCILCNVKLFAHESLSICFSNETIQCCPCKCTLS